MSESEGEISIKSKKAARSAGQKRQVRPREDERWESALERERARIRELELRFRAASSFPIHKSSGNRYREQSWEEKEDNERLLAGPRDFTPPG